MTTLPAPVFPQETVTITAERDAARRALRGEPSRHAATARRVRNIALSELDALLVEMRSKNRIAYDPRTEAQIDILDVLKKRLEGIHKHPHATAVPEETDGPRRMEPPGDSGASAEPEPGND